MRTILAAAAITAAGLGLAAHQPEPCHTITPNIIGAQYHDGGRWTRNGHTIGYSTEEDSTIHTCPM